MFKKNMLIGYIASMGFLFLLFVVFTAQNGLSWWTSPENELLIFFPLWAIGAFFIGYSVSKYYTLKKRCQTDEEEDS
ncbi:ACR3 family arsenite efflux pump ArsB [Dysgonomonas hofstadii]|uniref:ACR3 family arsenite efflux pump ArsB n=1 Tax=Dysgonomonas hofstadii TaxID=637886 RepID=A0A840CVL3_9BACT|nr:hypothetical protein [Dysgonomonas hofstadii]MBB4035843.1 ACR3 family arsenite efflux pump ArsB [Dysgonomonas hofstadii]